MYLLTSGYAEDLKNAPMEVWEGGKGGGRVQSRETLRVLWVGPQTCAIFVERTYTEGSDLQSLRGLAKPAVAGEIFEILSTFSY